MEQSEELEAPVSPQPSPLAVGVGTVMLPEGKAVLVIIRTVVGPMHFFLTHETATSVGEQIVAAARSARLGLVLPT